MIDIIWAAWQTLKLVASCLWKYGLAGGVQQLKVKLEALKAEVEELKAENDQRPIS